jgi:8-oxo-dGTP pyrophosphatase MutT (NUDIX family)
MLKIQILSPVEVLSIGRNSERQELLLSVLPPRGHAYQPKKKQYHTSAGFVCYYITPKCKEVNCKNSSNQRQVYVLLLRNKGGFWDFPKGAAEIVDNNNLLQTAFRELLEETSLTEGDVKTVHKNVDFSYQYYVHKRLKRVKLFLAELKKGAIKKKLYYDRTEIFTHRFIELQHLHTYFFWKEDIEVSNTIIAHLNRLAEQR